MLPTRDHDRILRLRLHAADDGARRRMDATLAGLSTLHPPGLPPDAILLVRRLAVTFARADRPRTRADRLVHDVADLAARAARPAHGPVPADAEAVMFAGPAELLACLALDGVHRRDAWWWALLGEPFAPPRFVDALFAAPEHLPGAVACLVERRTLADVLVQLHARDGRRLASALATKFGLPAVVAALDHLPDARPSRPLQPPWLAWAPELAASPWPPPVALFAAVSLGLRRAEPQLRGAPIAAALHAWATNHTPASPAPAPPSVATSVAADPPAVSTLPILATRPPHPRPPIAPPPSPPSSNHAPPAPRAPLSAATPPPSPTSPPAPRATPLLTLQTLQVASPASARPAPPPAPPSAARDEHPPAPRPVPEDSLPPAAPPPVASPRPVAALAPTTHTPQPTAALRTALGGSFYLINLVLALDLYGDFSQPLHPGPGLPLWDLLAELTARLLDDPPPDPLWGLLAGLAGRPRLVPDRDPCRAAPTDFAPPGSGHPPPAAGWSAVFADIEARARARLARALDLPAPQWLAQRAEILVGEARLDVRFALADHPPAVRIAGLDRDPGWVPAAGRDIRFWYDA